MEKEKKVAHSSFWTNIFNSVEEKKGLKISLKSLPIFQSLTKRDLDLLINFIHNRTFVQGEFIFYQGDPGIGLYIIREGEIKITRTNDEGVQNELATFTSGDFFGELALVDGEKRSASAIAQTEVKLSVIFKPDLDEFIEKYPKKGIKILTGISNIIAIRLRKLNEEHFSLLNQFNAKKEE